MNKFRTIFENVRARTSMYIQAATYQAAAAFVLGYDIASEGGVLVGFREWLIPQVSDGNNLVWSALVLRVAFPDALDPSAIVGSSAETERHAIEVLFRLIGEFDDVRKQRDGLRKVYLGYERWLRAQDWYDPESTQWIEPL